MKRCILLSGGPLADCAHAAPEARPGDYIIACDSGYRAALHFGLRPDLIVGDFDSYTGALPAGVEVVSASTRKDDTDTMLGLRHALEAGCDEVVIVGGFGGRLDHTLSNLQALAFLCGRGARGCILADRNAAWAVRDGTLELPRMEGWHLSVFAWDGVCEGVTLEGLEYPLNDFTMRPALPIGTSNEFAAETARITVRRGTLLVVASREDAGEGRERNG